MDKDMMERYLKRIGQNPENARTAEYLEKLIRAHLTHIPFENLEIYDEHKVPSLEPEKLYEKIVEQKRGGCCFELNGLFYELLKGLGFSVRAVAARVVWQKNVTPPVLHRAAIVQLEGKEYYCDIGYGGPGPKGLLELAQREQTVRGDRFTVEKNQQGWYVISRYHEGTFCPLLCVDNRAAEEADFLLMNFYCAKSEKVLFTQKRIVNLCTEDGSAALTDDTLTIRKHKMDTDGCAQTEVRQIICSNAEERSCILRTYFGL